MNRQGSIALVWIAASGLAVAAIAVVLLGQDRGPARSGRVGPGPAPPPGGAYATGGRPRQATPLDRAFAETLPAYAIAVDNWAKHQISDRELDAARAAVLDPATRTALGEAAADRLVDLLDRARDAARASSTSIDQQADALTSAVIAFDDQLTAAGLAYLVDCEVLEYPGDRRLVLLFSFAVDRVTRYLASTGPEVRALRLRRLDRLNWSYALLGFSTPRRREAFVLLDQVDERLVTRLLPQLGADPPPFYSLEATERAATWASPLQARARDMVRRSYRDGAADPVAAARLGQLLARRNRLFSDWDRTLAGRGISLDPPDALTLDWDYRGQLGPLIPSDQLDQLDALQRDLTTPAADTAFAAARDQLIASIELHEVQHRLDNLHPDSLPMPPELAALVGAAPSENGDLRPPLAELSAYLATLARRPDTIGVDLAILTQYLILEDHWNSAEFFAALVILEQLATSLGLEQRDLIADHEVDRAAVVDTFLALTDRPPAELGDAARRLWQRLFGRPLETLRTIDRGDRAADPPP